MARFSVPGYNIYDMIGQVLYNGDVVMMYWGGGNDGRRYRSYEYHILSISPRGRLSISGCSNIVDPKALIKQKPFDRETKYLYGMRLKEYY